MPAVALSPKNIGILREMLSNECNATENLDWNWLINRPLLMMLSELYPCQI
jgi:hypothetical protein